MKKIGYVGFTDGKPYYEITSDTYVDLGEEGVPVVDVYKFKKEAKKRFQDVREVFVKN